MRNINPMIGFQTLIFLFIGASILVVVIRPSITASREGKIIAFLVLLAAGVGASEHLERSEQTQFCLSCHIMEPYGRSLYVDDHPVRRMNPHLQPRISLLLRRAHWFSVSHSSERSLVVHSRLSHVPAYDHSLCHQQLQRKRTDSKTHTANDSDRLIEKQIP
jgi:hypothetical protein